MTSISGSFSAHVGMQTVLASQDQPNHELQLAEVHATQKSPDPHWNGSRLTYSSFADLVSGTGTQRGYFVNEHPDGDRDCGTFEGRITTSGGATVLEGTFTFTSGSGKLAGIHGGGTYKGRLVSPTQIEMTWSGSYETAAAAGHAA
jgi:hypothetical protein